MLFHPDFPVRSLLALPDRSDLLEFVDAPLAGSEGVRPSRPIPVRTTASRRSLKTVLAERNSTSAAGRQEFSGGPCVIAVQVDAPRVTTVR
jgi:hypothetical protein